MVKNINYVGKVIMWRNNLKWTYLLLGFVILISFVFPVFAVEEDQKVDLQSLPEMLTEALGLPTTANFFAGRLLASAIMLSLFMVPTLFACNKFNKEPLLPTIFVGLLVFGFCIAIGWLDYWFLLVVVMIIALMFSGKMRDWIGGGS